MNKNIFFLVFSLLFLLPMRPTLAETVTITADPYCPYICAPGEKPGYMIEIAQSILEANGHALNYVNMPWARALSEVRSGNIDSIMGTDEEEAPDFLFPVAFGEAADHFYGKKGEKWRYKGIKSLKSIRLGVIKDYSYGDAIDAYIEKNKGTDAVQFVTSEHGLAQNIKKLLSDRIDIIISNDKVFKYTVEEMKSSMDEFDDAGILFATYGIYMAFSPAPASLEKSKAYVEVINKGLPVLRDSGKLEAIMNKYGLSDWE
jgi:polar amino acid transport system substrate-binding protein